MIPGSGRSLGEGNVNPLLHSCLDRRAWQATVLGVIGVGQNLATKPLPPPDIDRYKDTDIFYWFCLLVLGAPLAAQLVKNPPAMQETPVPFLGGEDPLEKG